MQYTIGEISKRLDMQPSTLRYYDKEGLMPVSYTHLDVYKRQPKSCKSSFSGLICEASSSGIPFLVAL